MMKRFLNSVFAGFIFALAALITAALALQITGRDTTSQRVIWQVGMAALSTDLGVTATPSGTQANSYQITAGLTQVATVATIGDAVKLPSITNIGAPSNVDGSINLIIINNTANSMNVFPFLATDVIVNTTSGAAGGAGAALAVAALKMADCWSVSSTGRWHCSVS